jgi:hypothetical protein
VAATTGSPAAIVAAVASKCTPPKYTDTGAPLAAEAAATPTCLSVAAVVGDTVGFTPPEVGLPTMLDGFAPPKVSVPAVTETSCPAVMDAPAMQDAWCPGR